MQVIPVIDLKAGAVVHARAGDRARYRPLESRLCAGCAPVDVARALLDVHPFAALYVADLDAIAGGGDNAAHVDALRRAFPRLELWVDCGLGDARAARAWRARHDATPVLGTETMRDASVVRELAAQRASWVLSLDYRGERLLGDPGVTAEAQHWPPRVIAMTLESVGGGNGPDFARLADVLGMARGRKVFAAGGVRGGEDLAALSRAGAGGALVATALHDGRLSRAGIAAVASGPAWHRGERS